MKRNRTDSYVCTLSTYDEGKIQKMRWHVSAMNALAKIEGRKTRHRLVVRARLGKNSPYRHLYARGGKLYRSTSQDIKREHGARFDVYLQRRR